MNKLQIYFIGISLIFIHTFSQPLYATEQYGEFDFNIEWCERVVINQTTDMLYLSCGMDDLIYEIDSPSMQIVRSFPIETPYKLCLSNDDNYLFAESISQWPNSYLFKIRLSDGFLESIPINGHTAGFTMNTAGTLIWVLHYTFPSPDDRFTQLEAVGDHFGSSLVSKISTSTFSIIATVPGWVLPTSIFYSDFSGDIFVTHDSTISIGQNQGTAIGVFQGDTLSCGGETLGGNTTANNLGINMVPDKWTDDGHKIAISNLDASWNGYSMKIIDTTRSIEFKRFEPETLLTFIHPVNGEILGTEFLKKVPGTDILWATSSDGNPPEDPNRARYVIKINTVTHDYEVFEIPEATSDFGYFDVSTDGRILYLTQPTEGSVIKCAPGNNPPVCQINVVTMMPYVGTLPASIEFQANAFDEDNDDLTYHWDFDGDLIYDEPVDDSYTGDPDNPTHVYASNYDGLVNLKVTDNYQGECAASVTVIVEGT